MKQKIIHLLENLTEEILIALLAAGCAVSQINPKQIIQKYHNKNKIEFALPEFRQGKVKGISEGDLFLLEEYLPKKLETNFVNNKVDDYLDDSFQRIKLPKYISKDYVKALIKQESSNNPNAVSSWGARGLLQILEKTWQDYEKSSYDEAFNPEKNIRVGLRHLNWIDSYLQKNYPNYSELSNQEKQDIISAVHNVGIGRLERKNWDISKMPRETRRHVQKVRENYEEILNES